MPFAEVAVNAAAPIRQTFTYRIPDELDVVPGQAVYVPFGARTLQGIVMGVTEEAGFPDARDVGAVIDPRPLLSPPQIAVARWMSGHYLAPLFDCVSLMLPQGSKQRPMTVLTPLATAEELPSLGLTEKQARGPAYIIERGGGQPGGVGGAAQLREEGSQGAMRRAVLLEALVEEEAVPLPRARTLGLTPAALRDLEAEGLAVIEDVTVVRDPLAGRVYTRREAPALTADQEKAVGEIADALESGAGDPSHNGKRPVFLLHGVTGSGKTEGYLAALDHAVALGK